MDTEKTLAPCWPRKEFPTGPPIDPSNHQIDGWDQPVSSPLTNAGRWARRLGAFHDPLDHRDEPLPNNVHRRPSLSD